MNLQENLEQLRKNSEQMLWSGCGKCSRRKFYQTGYDDGLKKSDEELRELREYKSKVEKFISKNEHVISLVAVETVIDILKEELGYGD
jgi:hypothetical protein|nr:MAG TPA: CSP2 Chemosensory Protein, Pheromone, LIPID TRANSPORT [Caudoviricetes sp.]